MAEEEKVSTIDRALESFTHGIESLLTPHEHNPKSFAAQYLSIHGWVHRVGDWAISRGAFLIVIYIPLVIAAMNLFPPFARLTLGWLLLAFPIVGAAGLALGFWNVWIWYVQSNYIFNRTNPVLMEVRMPADITKSPRAMEQVLTSMWIRSGETTFIDRNWMGGVRPYTSLEICSFGGEVHFFIWCRKSYKNVIEAAMYSQYPEVEIVEVEDYATHFQFDPSKHNCFVTDYVYDPRPDFYPIKTYVDFELDEDPKEEHKVEPYGSVLEVLSTLNKNEQGWIQIVIRGYFGNPMKDDSWQKHLEEEVEAIREKASQQIVLNREGKEEVKSSFPRPTDSQKEQMQAMERQLGKLIFEVGMRGIYIAPAGKMRSAEYTAFRWIWRPFNNPNVTNSLRPRKAHNDFDYLWQDWGSGPDGVRYQLVTRRYFDAYRRRQFWHAPWIHPEVHMSTEVLATLWHPPSRTVQPPGLQRIAVTKSEAPPNLPM